jgi:plastocyanin
MRAHDLVRIGGSLVLATTLACLTPMAAVAATRTVEAGAGGARVFSPRTVRIARGDRIRWEQVAGSHDVTSRLSGYFKANGRLAANGQYTRTFIAAGSFGYFCDFHAGHDRERDGAHQREPLGGPVHHPGRQCDVDRHAMAQSHPGEATGCIHVADHRHDHPDIRDLRPWPTRDLPIPLGRPACRHQ